VKKKVYGSVKNGMNCHVARIKEIIYELRQCRDAIDAIMPPQDQIQLRNCIMDLENCERRLMIQQPDLVDLQKWKVLIDQNTNRSSISDFPPNRETENLAMEVIKDKENAYTSYISALDSEVLSYPIFKRKGDGLDNTKPIQLSY
jgi:hypothetical protein